MIKIFYSKEGGGGGGNKEGSDATLVLVFLFLKRNRYFEGLGCYEY